MPHSATSPARTPTEQENDPGRLRFLKHIAPFRLNQFEVPKGFKKSDALFEILEKAGVSRQDVKQVQEKTSEYTRTVAKAYFDSVKARNLNGMTAFENAAYLMNDIDYPGKGRSAQLKSVTVHKWKSAPLGQPEDSPTSISIPPPAVYQFCRIHAEGVGDGIDWPWTTDDGTRGDSCMFDYRFSFVPTVPAVYELSANVIVGGLYDIFANDGAFDSKWSDCDIQTGMEVLQILPGPIQTPHGPVDRVDVATPDLFLLDISSQNIMQSDVVAGSTQHILSTPLFPGISVDIDVWVYVTVEARGDTSFATMDLSQGTGGVACPGLFIE